MMPLVWQLDYTSADSERSSYIHVHRLSSEQAQVRRPHFKFTILLKDGQECSVWHKANTNQVRWEAPWREGGRRGVDMTDGCSLISHSVRFLGPSHARLAFTTLNLFICRQCG